MFLRTTQTGQKIIKIFQGVVLVPQTCATSNDQNGQAEHRYLWHIFGSFVQKGLYFSYQSPLRLTLAQKDTNDVQMTCLCQEGQGRGIEEEKKSHWFGLKPASHLAAGISLSSSCDPNQRQSYQKVLAFLHGRKESLEVICLLRDQNSFTPDYAHNLELIKSHRTRRVCAFS